MADRCIVVLMGVPGSGKTTFAKQLTDFLSTRCEDFKNKRIETVSFDELVPLDQQKMEVESAVARGAAAASVTEEKPLPVTSSEKSGWKKYRQQMMDKVSEVFETNRRNSLVIVDDNNYYPSMRYEYHQMARDLHVGFCQFHLHVENVEWAVDANSKRPEEHRVPEKVVREMFAKLTPPNPLANAWEAMSFGVDAKTLRDGATSQVFEICRSVVTAAMQNPPVSKPEVPAEERQASRTVCGKSLVHQVDKSLRRVLREKIREAMTNERPDMATFGRSLNAVRTELLADIKAGGKPEFRLPDQVTEAVQNGGQNVDSLLDPLLAKMFDLKMTTEK